MQRCKLSKIVNLNDRRLLKQASEALDKMDELYQKAYENLPPEQFQKIENKLIAE